MNIDRPVWIVHLEVLSFNHHACEEGRVGFLDAVLAAKDAFSAEERVAHTLMDHNCEILEMVGTRPLDLQQNSMGVLSNLVREVSSHPECVALSELSCQESFQEPELAAIY